MLMTSWQSYLCIFNSFMFWGFSSQRFQEILRPNRKPIIISIYTILTSPPPLATIQNQCLPLQPFLGREKKQEGFKYSQRGLPWWHYEHPLYFVYQRFLHQGGDSEAYKSFHTNNFAPSLNLYTLLW